MHLVSSARSVQELFAPQHGHARRNRRAAATAHLSLETLVAERKPCSRSNPVDTEKTWNAGRIVQFLCTVRCLLARIGKV
jgi:hypothetical protein